MAVRWRSIDNVLQKGLEIHTFIYIIFAPLAAPKKHYVIDDGLLLLLLVVQPLHWSFNELLMTLFAAAHLLCSHLRTHTQRESRTLVCCILPGAQINQHSLTHTRTHSHTPQSQHVLNAIGHGLVLAPFGWKRRAWLKGHIKTVWGRITATAAGHWKIWKIWRWGKIAIISASRWRHLHISIL